MPGNLYTPTVQDILKWPKPQYKNPPEEQSWLGAFAIVWQLLATVLVLGRLYLRINKRSGPFGWDDALIFIAWLWSIAFTATACNADWNLGIGRHAWNIPPSHYTPTLLNAWLSQVFFLWTTCFTKCSILLCYRRMAKTTYSNGWIYTVWFFMFVTIASCAGIFLGYCFMCTPLRYYWDYLKMDALHESHSCINGDSVTIATGILTIASDFWTAAIPCIMFQKYSLDASRRQKILLNSLFCIGFLVTGVGIARTYYLWKIGHDQDLSWIGYKLFVSSVVEIQLAIICVCAPFLRAFFRSYFPELSMSTRSRSAAETARRSSVNVLTGTTAARTSYHSDTKGFPLSDRSMLSPTKDMFTITEEEQEWARQQVQQNSYKPPSPTSTSSRSGSFEVKEEEQREARERLRKHESIHKITEKQDEDWARAQVSSWVTKRPIKEGDEQPILPDMSPPLPSDESWLTTKSV